MGKELHRRSMTPAFRPLPGQNLGAKQGLQKGFSRSMASILSRNKQNSHLLNDRARFQSKASLASEVYKIGETERSREKRVLSITARRKPFSARGQVMEGSIDASTLSSKARLAFRVETNLGGARWGRLLHGTEESLKTALVPPHGLCLPAWQGMARNGKAWQGMALGGRSGNVFVFSRLW
jgi:hypothetical protein